MSNSLVKGLRIIGDLLYQKAPTILTGIAMGGVVSTTVFAVKDTIKAKEAVDKKREKTDKDLGKVEIFKETWKYYIPTAISGTTTVVCVLSSHVIQYKRTAALAAALGASREAYDALYGKMKEELGEKKAKRIEDEATVDRLDNKIPDTMVPIETHNGNQLFLDSATGTLFRSSVESIKDAEKNVIKQLVDEQFVSLNDFLWQLGLKEAKLGDLTGWSYGTCELDVDLSKSGVYKPLNEAYIIVDYDIKERFRLDNPYG